MGFNTEIEYESLLEAVPDGLLLVDKNGRIRDMNAHLADLFGYSREELKGEPVEILVPDHFRDDHANQRNEYLSNPSRRSMGSGLQLVGKRKDGSMLPVDVSLAPVKQDDKQRVVASVRDVSDRLEHQQRLSVLTRILRHDIRNRLTLILGHARMCQEELEDLDAKLEEFRAEDDNVPIHTAIGDLQKKSGEILRLLSEFDEFTDRKIADVEKIINAAVELDSIAERARRIDKVLGTSEREADPVELESVLETAITTIQLAHPEASLEADLGANVIVYQPKDLIRISVEELLKNAIVHNDSPEPHVSIEISTSRPSIVGIRISDSGPGLPKREQEVLSLQKEQPLMHSMGFGLWEVNWVVSKMGGKLTFEENHPQGTTAVIQVPVNPNENGQR